MSEFMTREHELQRAARIVKDIERITGTKRVEYVGIQCPVEGCVAEARFRANDEDGITMGRYCLVHALELVQEDINDKAE